MTEVFLFMLIGIFLMVLLKVNNDKNVGTFGGFVFGCLVYYSVIPILTKMNFNNLTSKYPNLQYFIGNKNFENDVFLIFLLLIGMVLFVITYKYANNNKIINSGKYDYSFSEMIRENKFIPILGVITFVVGGISLIIFFVSFGGISRALSLAETNRSFSSSLSDYVNYKASLLIIPAKLITVTPYIYYLLMCYRKKKIDKFIFITSFLLSILFYLFSAGRAPLLSFLLCFLYVFIKKFWKRAWALIIISGLFSLPLLDLLDKLFVYFRTKYWQSTEVNYVQYINQFIHPYRNVLNINDMINDFGYRKGSDFLTTFLNLIPGINYPASYENTSFFLSGTKWRVIGGVPNDVITFGYIEFGVFGVVLLFGVLGMLFGKLDLGLKLIPEGNVRNFLSSALVLNAFFLVANADFEPLVRSNFILIMLTLLLFNIVGFKKRTRRDERR